MSFWKSAFGALALISVASPALPQDGPGVLSRPVASLVPRGSEKPSFDCAKARTAAARLICVDGELARLDGELGVAFQKRKAQILASDLSKFVADELAWIRDRNTRCGLDGKNSAAIEVLASSKSCMAKSIQERIAFLTQTDSLAAGVSGPLQLQPPHDFDWLFPPQTEPTNSAAPITPSEPSALADEPNDFTLSPECAEAVRRADAEANRSGPKDFDTLFPKCVDSERRAWIVRHRPIALAEATAAEEKAFRALADCTLTQAVNLMVTNETAEAVAGAALVFCGDDLEKATRAVQYKTDLQLWFEGPQPRPRLSSDIEAERSLAKTLLPGLAARIMQSRAEAAKAPRPQASATGKTLGTGFFVAKDGKALTNAHVVDRCHEVFVGFEGQQAPARVVARDNENDLALLGTDLHPASAANWRLSIRQGEDIVVYGFPLTGVLAAGGNVAVGNVTALAGLGNDSRFLQISAPVQPGNSGGPLLDRSGNVVGVVVAQLDALGIASATGDIPQNVNFAIKASVAAAFLDAQGVLHGDGAPKSEGGLPNVDDVFPLPQPKRLDNLSPLHDLVFANSRPALSTPDIAERAKGLSMQVACVR